MREHTEQMQSPRFLWVPFPLGRPFGAPNEPAFQKRVLHDALALLEREDGPVILEDFPDDAPDAAGGDEEEEQSSWSCPIAFAPPQEDRPALVALTLDEISRLAPWHELGGAASGGGTATDWRGVGPLPLGALVEALGEVGAGNFAPAVATEIPFGEWVRLGCDDLHNYYEDAARAQPGHATPGELKDWFWRETSAARLVAAAALAMKDHPDPLTQMLALRAMVPREYLGTLAPEIDPVAWRSVGSENKKS